MSINCVTVWRGSINSGDVFLRCTLLQTTCSSYKNDIYNIHTRMRTHTLTHAHFAYNYVIPLWDLGCMCVWCYLCLCLYKILWCVINLLCDRNYSVCITIDYCVHVYKESSSVCFIISPNEVFGDIMVLASPPPPPRPPPRPPPVDPDDVNTLTRKIFNLSLSNFIWG